MIITLWCPTYPSSSGLLSVDIPKCSSGSTIFMQSWISRGVGSIPTTWDGLCVSSCCLFPQSAMVGIFVWISYRDLPHQAWNLSIVVSALWNFVQWANSKPSPPFRSGINALLFALWACLKFILWWLFLWEFPSLTLLWDELSEFFKSWQRRQWEEIWESAVASCLCWPSYCFGDHPWVLHRPH